MSSIQRVRSEYSDAQCTPPSPTILKTNLPSPLPGHLILLSAGPTPHPPPSQSLHHAATNPVTLAHGFYTTQITSWGFLPRLQAESRFCFADPRLHGVVSTGAGSVALLNSGGTSAHLALYPVTCLTIILLLPRSTRKESSRRTLTVQKTLLEEDVQLFTIPHTHWPPG